ncbi:hypothetical protein GGS20DRAFT_254097 [Poronia punctata]|nr:hypothetical protein GGS20DRAFT_254097 [Poronia punctata]
MEINIDLAAAVVQARQYAELAIPWSPCPPCFFALTVEASKNGVEALCGDCNTIAHRPSASARVQRGVAVGACSEQVTGEESASLGTLHKCGDERPKSAKMKVEEEAESTANMTNQKLESRSKSKSKQHSRNRPSEPAGLRFALRPSPSQNPSPSPSAPGRKRVRDVHDVDGPGTDKLASKKRRILLRLITSRLSLPYSLPATHLVVRRNGGGSARLFMPFGHRMQQFTSSLQHPPPPPLQTPWIIPTLPLFSHTSRALPLPFVLRRGGHSGVLVRKVAILNRMRIRVRQGAGFAEMMSAKGIVTSSQHEATIVRAKAAKLPSWGQGGGGGGDSVSRDLSQVLPAHLGGNSKGNTKTVARKYGAPLLSPLNVPGSRSAARGEPGEEEDNTAFPANNFQVDYADLSDDDPDDVYADFGVLFGSGPPETRAVTSLAEEKNYEENLDELDGIPWFF